MELPINFNVLVDLRRAMADEKAECLRTVERLVIEKKGDCYLCPLLNARATELTRRIDKVDAVILDLRKKKGKR